MSSTADPDEIAAALADLNPGERRLAEIRIDRIMRRKRALHRFPSPGHLAKFLDAATWQTPLMRALDNVIMAADAGAARRWIISTPPQEGKTQRVGTVGPLWLLLRNPARRIVMASYEQGIAARSGLAVRQAIEAHGGGYKGDRTRVGVEDNLGLLLDPDRALQTNWQLADTPGRRNGGMVCVGVGGALTGRSGDVMIVDDAVKDARAADSPQARRVVQDWFQAVVTTRLAPDAIVIVIGTRWHENDLIGWLLKQDALRPTPRWSELTIPAQAKADDPLGRERGQFLLTARGRRTDEDWALIRADVGERWWAAMYQQDPSPPAGGVFQREWIERNRVKAPPELVKVEVFVDPADNEGEGDEAGIIVIGRGVDQRLYILADESGHYTVARWMRVALLAAVRWRAIAVRYERSLSGLDRAARTAWKDLLREARVLAALCRPLPGTTWPAVPDGDLLESAVSAVVRDDADAAERVETHARLMKLWPLVPMVMDLPETGIPVKSFQAKGSKTYRAQIVAPQYESNHVSHVGHLLELERQQITWQEGQDSPDRMDAAVHALNESSRVGVATMTGASGQLPTRTNPAATIRRQVGGRGR